MKLGSLLVIGVLSALASYGCGAPGADPAAQRGDAAVGPVSTPPTPADEGPELSSAASEAEERMPAPDASSPGEPVPEVAEAVRWPLQVTVEPECLVHGAQGTATVTTVGGARLSLAVVYADGRGHEQWYVGPVSDDGSFVWNWTVPPQAAAGEARILVAAREPVAGGRSGTAEAVLRIAVPVC